MQRVLAIALIRENIPSLLHFEIALKPVRCSCIWTSMVMLLAEWILDRASDTEVTDFKAAGQYCTGNRYNLLGARSLLAWLSKQ